MNARWMPIFLVVGASNAWGRRGPCLEPSASYEIGFTLAGASSWA